MGALLSHRLWPLRAPPPPPTVVIKSAEALMLISGRFLEEESFTSHVLVPLPPLPSAKHLDQGGEMLLVS